jgi:CBS-domain-containing membrane protein
MPATARDVMTRSVVCVGADTPLVEVYRLFLTEQIHGAPVVDDEELLIGVVTSTDLLRGAEEERDTAVASSDYLRDLIEFSGPDWANGPADFQDRLAHLTVAEVMTPSAVTVRPDTPVAEVARTLRQHQVHRVWVEDGGRVCGVVSTFDLLPLVEKMG